MKPDVRLLLAVTLAPVVGGSSSSPIVDLGYSSYQGHYEAATGLNIWKGYVLTPLSDSKAADTKIDLRSIRYASPPVGQLRWQPPRPPAKNNGRIIPAVDQPPVCPQSGAAGTPAIYGFNSGPGDEDCLFLNVYAPPGASDLPVFVWIRKLLLLSTRPLPASLRPLIPVIDRRWRLWAVWRCV
jgi:hypothetical protein